MSYFTGKCDFYDHCYMIGNPKEVLEKATIYYGDARVDIKTEKDLFPYATHLVASMASSSESQTIRLSKDSYINEEEIESIAWRVRDCILLARKAKKEKTPFTYEWAKDKITSFSAEDIPWKQIIEILNKNPNIIKFHLSKDYREDRKLLEQFIVPWYFSHVHLTQFNRYREIFVEECVRKGFAGFMIKDGTIEEMEGEYHPVIWKMCWDIKDYYEAQKKYKGENNV